MTVTLANRVGAASSVRDPRRTMILAPLGTALIYPNEDEVINQLAEISEFVVGCPLLLCEAVSARCAP
jgi:hypothetical protein